ncbi:MULTISPECIES: hypothetical protein [unclassified Novosphingobium]|nr:MULTISPECIES: hypothetical protein [unclassified Novosphingobium]HQV04704.1 hypothetical protein [Novosphingobium sp.]
MNELELPGGPKFSSSGDRRNGDCIGFFAALGEEFANEAWFNRKHAQLM